MNAPRAAAMIAVIGLLVPDGGTNGGSAPWVYWIQPLAFGIGAVAIAGALLSVAWRCLRPREDWRESAIDFEPGIPPPPSPPRPPRNRRTHRLARFLSASPTLRRL